MGNPEYILYTDHIMWQPTHTCRLGCKGCYVSDLPQELRKPLNYDILDLIFGVDKVVACSQFTVSLDDLRECPSELLSRLQSLWNTYEGARKLGVEGGLPELCVTANNWNTIVCWCRDLGMTPQQFVKPLSILSLSNLPSLGKLCQEIRDLCEPNKTLVNYNKLITPGSYDTKAFEMGCRYSDHIYLVLRKAPLGGHMDPPDFEEWLKARRKVKEIAPQKLTEDFCVLESMHFNATLKYCNAGKKKIHVWPGGTVTSCPYDSRHVHRGASKKPVLEEVKAAVLDSGCKAMSFCSIPDVIKSMKNEVAKPEVPGNIISHDVDPAGRHL